METIKISRIPEYVDDTVLMEVTFQTVMAYPLYRERIAAFKVRDVSGEAELEILSRTAANYEAMTKLLSEKTIGDPILVKVHIYIRPNDGTMAEQFQTPYILECIEVTDI